MHRTASCLQRGGVWGFKPGVLCVGKKWWFGGTWNLFFFLRGNVLFVKIQHLAVAFFGGDEVYICIMYI